ncbi:uncharacterized protein LOC144123133 [Amblyomma americanum]
MLTVAWGARVGERLRAAARSYELRQNSPFPSRKSAQLRNVCNDSHSLRRKAIAQASGSANDRWMKTALGLLTATPAQRLPRYPALPLVAEEAARCHGQCSWNQSRQTRGFSTAIIKEHAYRSAVSCEGGLPSQRGYHSVAGKTTSWRAGVPEYMIMTPTGIWKRFWSSTTNTLSTGTTNHVMSPKSRCRDVAERSSVQGGQKLALPPWMTSRRPYFMSDCEKAFKCLAGKLPETTSWDQFLDVGCGAGDLTRCIIKEFGGRHRVVVATERSADAVKVLRRNAAQRDILYEVMDVEKDVSEALASWGRFRRIFSFYHLESVRDKQRALENMRRLLWDYGGELFLMYRVQSNLKPLYKMLAKSGRWSEVAADYKAFHPKLPKGEKCAVPVCKMLEDAGFQVKQSKVLETNWRLSATENLDELIMGTSQVMHRVLPEQREQFIRDCAEAAAQVLPRSGDELIFSYTSFMAWAVVDPAKTGSDGNDSLAARFFWRRPMID